MNPTFLFHVPTWILALITFFLSVFVDWLGFQYRKRYLKGEEDDDSQGLIEASILGLTALLLSFTFNLSATKFEERRKIIIEEANDIGTAILRCDLYPDSVRSNLLKYFRSYLEARIAYYDAGDDEEKIRTSLSIANVDAGNIWKVVASQSFDRNSIIRSGQMIPAVNSMIDIVTTRDDSRIAKVPSVVFLILFVLLMISAFLLGYKQKEWRKPIHVYSWTLMVSMTLFLMVELDRPRKGVLNLDGAEQKIVELRSLLDRPSAN